MKRLSLQWRITLLTALLIAGTCICLNLLLYHSGAVSIDSLNGFVFEYTPESSEDPDGLAIEISDSQMSEFISRFSDEAYDVKTDFGRKGWLITVAVTIVSAAIAYFVSGQALKPLRKLSQQAEKIDQDSISDIRLNEDTVKEFRQLSVSVNLMLDRLSESFATQRQFSGNAAHELRTPLAIMQTKLELFAAEHKNLEGDTAELVRSQAEQLDRLSKLVHTLLEMSNLSSAPRSDRIELAPLVEEIITDLTPLASQNDITMEQDCDNVVITGSDALIYRLVFNLIENAVKYNRRGGSVSVSVHKENSDVVVRVSDTGCGIPEEYRESIFQPFFRVDKSRSRQMGGVGLGLALVHEIAVLHGGSVRAEPGNKVGTVFIVTLPAGDDHC
ncbi:MAG TPA: two-component sensor histidine kinase [Ruminococcaceae bacterium]|nr:two-component sensor histidine kinase [Oscillospiraceae bacterium]HCK51199.1 two-component sensor histidine kinase [Oscillospiraceae bacterium]